jgi:hypothetical protein
MTTARDIITKALQKIGVSFNGTVITADEANDALDALNALLESFANDSMLVYARSWETFNITGGDGNYTMGVGGDFNTARPLLIVSSYIADGNTDYNLSIISDEMYNNQISQKDTLSVPAYINSDNGSPLVNIRLYPVPDKSYQIFLLTEKAVTRLGLDDEVTLPTGWERMLIYNLAVDVAPEYGLQLDPLVLKIAEDSKGLVRANIMRNRSMDSNPLVIRSGRFENGWM